MRETDAFSGYHPAVNALYFALVLGFTMFFSHPACLAASLLSALAYAVCLRGRRAVRGALACLPLLLAAAAANPLFNHAGATILAYLPSGNPLTLESILCGLGSSCMLGAVLLWFTCCTAVLSSDKVMYLFGRVLPVLSLLLSMTLCFVPRLRAQLRAVRDAQRSLGGDRQDGPLCRMRTGAAIVSAALGWSLEDAVQTADSMRSRGYGLRGRTSFSLWRLEERDRCALLWLLFSAGYVACGALAGALRWRYFPTVRGAQGVFAASFWLAFLTLCLTPVILHAGEVRAWRRMRSEI